MAARTLDELQKQYGGRISDSKKGGMMRGPGPRRGHGGPGVRAKGKPKNTKQTIKRLLSYISKFKFRLVLVLVCMLLSTLASLTGGYILRPVINALVGESELAFFGFTFTEPLEYLAVILSVIAVVYLFGIVASYTQARLMLSVSMNAIENLRNDLFKKVQKLPVREFDSDSNGTIMSSFTNDIDNIDMMLHNTVVSLISGSITLIGTLSMMIYTNIWLTLITLVFIPLFMFLAGQIAMRSSKYYVGQQAALGAINGYIEESVSGQKVIKVFNHETICEEEFDTLNADMREKQFKAQFFGGIMGPILGNTSQISYALTAGIGGVLCVLTGFDVGGLSVFVNYSRQFSMPINQISQQMSTIFSALAGAERVFALMDRNPEIESCGELHSAENIKGDVVLENVSFGYSPDKPVLKNISLYAHPGQKIAFV